MTDLIVTFILALFAIIGAASLMGWLRSHSERRAHIRRRVGL